jgi:hypothetical protein
MDVRSACAGSHAAPSRAAGVRASPGKGGPSPDKGDPVRDVFQPLLGARVTAGGVTAPHVGLGFLATKMRHGLVSTATA